jgi:hypothetical protein
MSEIRGQEMNQSNRHYEVSEGNVLQGSIAPRAKARVIMDWIACPVYYEKGRDDEVHRIVWQRRAWLHADR